MTQTTNQQPTATLTNGVFSCVVDGVEWRSTNNFDFVRETGEFAVGGVALALRAAAYRAMGEALTQASVQRGIDQARRGEFVEGPEIPDPDGLTESERAAVTGAIRDAKRGLKTSVFPVPYSWYQTHIPEIHRANRVGGKVYWGAAVECPSGAIVGTRWDTRTGTRTVLDVDAFREAVGVESEEWRDCIMGRVRSKNQEPGVKAQVTTQDTIDLTFRDTTVTHTLVYETGHWHTRPEPEDTYTGSPDNWEPGIYVPTTGPWDMDARLIKTENHAKAWTVITPNGAVAWLGENWEASESEPWLRISPNPPRVRVEEG